MEAIHERGLIYRDVKPDNFLWHPQEQTVYIVDFGMAKQWWTDRTTRQHIPFRDKKSLSGTARYMSINTHLGREQSRRDDLESLAHVFLYFSRGSLPWQGLKTHDNKQPFASTREKYEAIGRVKMETTLSVLSEGLPTTVFTDFLEYTRSLGFEEKPDYAKCRLMFSVSGEENTDFDWNLSKSPTKPLKHQEQSSPNVKRDTDSVKGQSWFRQWLCFC